MEKSLKKYISKDHKTVKSFFFIDFSKKMRMKDSTFLLRLEKGAFKNSILMLVLTKGAAGFLCK